jgi:DNA-binding response OmpR family regulator
MDTIYRSLRHSEQKVLEKVVTRQNEYTEEEGHSLAYFKKMNLLSKNNNITIGFMSQYLGTRPHQDQHIEINAGRVFINNVNVDSVFTKKEHRVFLTLLKHRGEIVTRDAIAQSIWPSSTDQHYSDWAIDQLIARLRKRLLKLSMAPKVVHAIRGKGYRLNY